MILINYFLPKLKLDLLSKKAYKSIIYNSEFYIDGCYFKPIEELPEMLKSVKNYNSSNSETNKKPSPGVYFIILTIEDDIVIEQKSIYDINELKKYMLLL